MRRFPSSWRTWCPAARSQPARYLRALREGLAQEFSPLLNIRVPNGQGYDRSLRLPQDEMQAALSLSQQVDDSMDECKVPPAHRATSRECLDFLLEIGGLDSRRMSRGAWPRRADRHGCGSLRADTEDRPWAEDRAWAEDRPWAEDSPWAEDTRPGLNRGAMRNPRSQPKSHGASH